MANPREAMLGELREDGTIVFERTLPGPIERVWTHIIDGDKRSLWLAGGDMPTVPDAMARMRFDHAALTDDQPPAKYTGADAPLVMDYEVLLCEPPRHIRFTWPDARREDQPPPSGAITSVVDIQLIPRGKDVVLRLTHSGVHYGRDGTIGLLAGWDAHLALLGGELDGTRQRRFWAYFAEAEALYAKRYSAA